MSYTEDEPVVSENASFWEPKCYSRTVKRVENANKLCSDFSQMISERASIENSYADNLGKWSKKWRSLIDSGIEYGTGAEPWIGMCEEASRISQMHKHVGEILTTEVQPQVRRWHKDQFHKTHVPVLTLKESKQFEHDFEVAQKPWNKKLKKLYQCRKEYYTACKSVRSLKVQAENAHNDPSGTPDQQEIKLKKIQEKTKKAETDQSRSLAAYQGALAELASDKSRYVDDMKRVFDRTQTFEENRLNFFKQMFYCLFEALDLTKKSEIESIYSDLLKTIDKSTPTEDLQLWSNHHGVDMLFVCPQFQEYSPELAAISKKKSHGLLDGGSKGITLTNLTHVGSPKGAYEDDTPKNGSIRRTETVAKPNDDSYNNNDTTVTDSGHVPQSSYDDDEQFDDSTMNDLLYDDGRPGIPVRALYDYTGVEDDELTFVAGDVFEKLEDENEQGWAKGRKAGRLGLYPANYVEVV